MTAYFFGIDVGTQGVRVILVDQHGTLVASGARKFAMDNRFREEQSPLLWWDDCVKIMDQIVEDLPQSFNRSAVQAISVTSTSGTVIPLDINNQPLHQAIMYSDTRSAEQGKQINTLAKRHLDFGYTGFNASSGISKMIWYRDTYPHECEKIALWIHASDYIVGRLSGNYKATDYTNALKSGYDVNKLEWPDYLFTDLLLEREWMQEVVPSGTVVGELEPALASRWGLPPIKVVVGMTDGCASQVASGAVKPGEWNTTIGTTMVIKGVVTQNIVDPLGRVYSHRHPEGYWMPGGASNTGADWISLDFASDIDAWNAKASRLVPTGQIAWPLKQQGERYPIISTQAREIVPENIQRDELYAANLEGVAFIERMAYEILEDLSGEPIHSVYTAGGGSNSDVWLRIRAGVLDTPVYKCREASGALGAAIMAASKTYYSSLTEAVGNMTLIEKEAFPDVKLVERYDEQYAQFKHKLETLGYM